MSAGVFTVSARLRHTATVIFLHGLGDTGYGWSLAMKQIQSPHIKYICPTANVMPVSLNDGARMPAWYNIYKSGMQGSRFTIDEQGVKEAASRVHSMIKDEVDHGIASDRIVLGGFSQGGAIALYAGVTAEKQLAGITALSTYFPLDHNVFQIQKANAHTPIFQCHGDCDLVVPYQHAVESSELLKLFCTRYKFKTYKDLGHSSSDQVLRDVKSFIGEHIPPLNSNM
ncbi:acyl-protein thioesterase 1-like [Corticium candelabrum]|uniref:acyl-protein thioesterase 1-like n=1 Tax=Corticium candelabrum TaxID=121492 RepID=UPI002E257050|nr:acyl-protein thioesterase 1-like [Corticium candelabrum]